MDLHVVTWGIITEWFNMRKSTRNNKKTTANHLYVPASFYDIFGLASVDIRLLPGAWIVELLGVIQGVQD